MAVQIAPIMSPPPELGCAVHPNGSLKDASEIDWHFNKDDNTPFTVAEKSHKSGPSQTLIMLLTSELYSPSQGPPEISGTLLRSDFIIFPQNKVAPGKD